MRALSLSLLGLLAITCVRSQDFKAIVPIQVSHKIALVIGNAQYRSQNKLTNTENDETDVAAVLRGLSFDEVLEGRNLSLRDMDRLLQQFFGKIHAGDLAFFYYSGHGMSEGEENYLLPVDFAADSDMSLDFRAFPVSKIRDKLEGSGARLRVMVLDACRSNPYSKAKGDTGLIRLEPRAEGTIIAFAAEHGKVAFETNGRNSRYTAALLDELRNPQTHLREIFFDVQNRVYEESGERQKPAVYAELIGKYYFKEMSARAELPKPEIKVPIVEAGHRVGETEVNPKDGLTYVWIPPGTFMMGCSPGDSECSDDEKPAHEVTITNGFWLGQTPVTQAAYQRVMGINPSHLKGDNLPVEQVTWEEARAYCAAIGVRLPTEAEWEYAARAGTSGSRYGNLYDIAWYDGNSGGHSQPAGQKLPNAYSLHDMLGNVWQWTEDWYDRYGPGAQSDPRGPSSGQVRVLRGGSWTDTPYKVRASARIVGEASKGNYDVGFRCVGE